MREDDDAPEVELEEVNLEEIEAVARPSDLAQEVREKDDAEATQSTEDDNAGDEDMTGRTHMAPATPEFCEVEENWILW